MQGRVPKILIALIMGVILTVSVAPISVSKMSESEGVRSLEMIKVRKPPDAKCRAVVADVVVFPTPPFPPNMRTRFLCCSNEFSDMGLPNW